MTNLEQIGDRGAQVISVVQLRDLYERPWWATPAQTTALLGSYAVLSGLGLWSGHWLVWGSVWIVQGFILSCFLGAAHDCAHRTFVRNPIANRIAGSLWSSVVLFNFALYKHYHLEHHRYTSVPGDTEPQGEFESVWAYLKNLPTTAFFVSFWTMSVNALRGQFPHFIRGDEQRRSVLVDDLILSAWIVVVLTLTVAYPTTLAIVYWAPMLVYFPMVFFTSLPEHYGCDIGPDAWRNTRSLRSNAIYRFLFWNGNFHAEHHLYPGVPSWNLPKLHEIVAHRLANVERSYVKFHINLIWSLASSKRKISGRNLDPLDRVHFENCSAAGSNANAMKQTERG